MVTEITTLKIRHDSAERYKKRKGRSGGPPPAGYLDQGVQKPMDILTFKKPFRNEFCVPILRFSKAL